MPGNRPNMSLQVTVCDPGVSPGMPDEHAASNTDYDVPALSLIMSISAIPPSFRTILVPIDSYSRRRINYSCGQANSTTGLAAERPIGTLRVQRH